MPDSDQQGSSGETKFKLRNIRNVPRGVMGALIADSERSGRSLNDVALCILAEFFDTDCPEGGNPSRSEPKLSDQLQLRMPHHHPLWGCLWAASQEWQTTESSAAIGVLARHYEIPYQFVRRGRKPKVTQ